MRILAVGAHPDDVEMGCGGSLFRWKREGHDVHYVVLTTTLDQPGNETIVEEFRAGVGMLGLPGDRVELHDLETTRLPEHAEEVRHILERVRDGFRPDLVLTNSSDDIMQDHVTAREEACRVFRNSTLLGYDSVRSSIRFDPGYYVRLEREDARKKVELVNRFKSQMRRAYVSEEIVMGQMVHRGAEVGCEHAEAFEVIRVVE